MSAVKTNVHTIIKDYYGKGSVEVSSPAKDDEGGVRRLAISADKLVTEPIEGMNTTADIIDFVARTHGSRNAVGWRDVIKVHVEEKEVTKNVSGKEVKEKKKWQYFELSDYKFLSYIDFKVAIEEIARGLVHLGVGKGAVFNVYSQTR
jgi:long-chain acyl-CoA synthetase